MAKRIRTKGWNYAFDQSAGVGVRELGPFPPGAWLDRAEVALYVDAGAVTRFGLSLTPSAGTGLDVYPTGRPLIDRAAGVLLGLPCIALDFQAAGSLNFTVALGIEIGSGPMYVLLAVEAGVGQDVMGMCSVFTRGELVFRSEEEPP